MTDTTALREECAQWVKESIGEAVDTRMALNGDGNDYMSWDMSVIWLAWLHLSGKLEAERQRVAGLEDRLRITEESLVAANDLLAAAEAEIAALNGKLANPLVLPGTIALNELIAIRELKGDQVPVAYLYSASFERGGVEGQLTDAPGCDMPVYDRPQKPVVLLGKGFKRDVIGGMSAPETEWFSRKDITAAIEAVGGIVKDGE